MAAQLLRQLFQPLLLQSASPMVSCGEKHLAWGRGSPSGRPQRRARSPPPRRGCGSVAAGSAPDCRGCLGKVLPCLWALGAGRGAARRPLAGLWMGLALPRPGLVPAAALRCGEPAAGRAAGSPVALVTAGRRYYGKEAGALGRAGRSREKVANAGLASSLSAAAVPGAVRGGVLHRRVPYAVTKLPGFRLPGERSVPWGPAGRNAEGPRLELKLAEKDCSAVPCQPRGKPPSVAGGAQL